MILDTHGGWPGRLRRQAPGPHFRSSTGEQMRTMLAPSPPHVRWCMIAALGATALLTYVSECSARESESASGVGTIVVERPRDACDWTVDLETPDGTYSQSLDEDETWFAEIPAGRSVVVARCSGICAPRVREVRVLPGATVRVSLPIVSSCTLTGVVRDSRQPLAAAEVTVFQVAGLGRSLDRRYARTTGLSTAVTDESGKFEVRGPVDSVIVRVTAPGHRDSYFLPGALVAGSVHEERWTLALESQVTGTVTAADGSPVGGALVVAAPADTAETPTSLRSVLFAVPAPQSVRDLISSEVWAPVAATTNEHGEFVLDGLGRLDTYQILVLARGHESHRVTLRTQDRAESRSIALTIRRRPDWSVRIQRQDGRPIPGALCSVWPTSSWVPESISDADGIVRFPWLVEGQAHLKIYAAGYRPRSMAVSVRLGTTASGSVTLTARSASRRSGDHVLRGRLVDARGRGVYPGFIRADSRDRLMNVRPGGGFVLRDLAERPSHVIVGGPGRRSVRVRVPTDAPAQLVAGQRTGIWLHLRLAEDVEAPPVLRVRAQGGSGSTASRVIEAPDWSAAHAELGFSELVPPVSISVSGPGIRTVHRRVAALDDGVVSLPIVIESSRPVTGTLLDSLERPVEGVQLAILDSAGRTCGRGSTDARGRFTLDGRGPEQSVVILDDRRLPARSWPLNADSRSPRLRMEELQQLDVTVGKESPRARVHLRYATGFGFDGTGVTSSTGRCVLWLATTGASDLPIELREAGESRVVVVGRTAPRVTIP